MLQNELSPVLPVNPVRKGTTLDCPPRRVCSNLATRVFAVDAGVPDGVNV